MVDVRYQDDAVVVVDKPFGLPSQAPRGGGDNLFDRVRKRYADARLLHRLDTPASGLLLFPVDPRAYAPLTEAFRTHRVVRGYRAVLAGTGLGATVDGPMTWAAPVDGRSARTRVHVVGTGEGCTAVELWPATGRKHQLRVHAALDGRPMCGDRRYGGDAGRRWPRLALHAGYVGFVHPLTQVAHVVTSPVPDDLTALWQAAGGGALPMASDSSD